MFFFHFFTSFGCSIFSSSSCFKRTNSYIIQNFHDTLRQNVIDLIQGKLPLLVAAHEWDVDVLETTLKIAVTAVGSPPKGYMPRGALGAEESLIEDLILEGSKLSNLKNYF